MKCPKCKKEIEWLEERRSGYETSRILFNKETKQIYWEDETFSGDGNVTIYSCPECYEELDFNEEEMENFLKKKDDELTKTMEEKLKQIEEKNA